jgi:two-component system cell cycle sensor histidine kinase/response regulator CckA
VRSLPPFGRGYLFRRGQDPDIVDSLFSDATDGIALVDSTGTVLRANPRFADLAGVSAGMPAWLRLPPQSVVSLANALHAGRACTVDTAGTDWARRAVLRVALLPAPHGGALMRLSDHTHERDLEDQLNQAQRLQAVGELAGGIAHDFNNLLTAILGAADDLRLRARQDADREDIDLIRDSSARGAALVRQLLAFSRQQTLQPRVLALNDAVRATASLLHRVLGASVTLKLQLEEPGRLVRIDPTQLDQVLVNLAVNARHAMSEGGELTIATGRRLLLQAETLGGEQVPPGRYASLIVRDTGAGIPPDVLPRIFEPFFTTRRDRGGTGLGLSTVHGIVSQSGGFITVDSAPGLGTSFTILLPRHEGPAGWRPAPPPAASLPAPTAPAAGRTVLLVDDEAPLRRLAERVLARAGWQVMTASCGEEALAIAGPGDPGDAEEGAAGVALSAVVSDVVMPGLDGPDLVRRLRATRPHLPALLMSGYADSALRAELASADITFLSKPFTMADLTRALEEMLRVSGDSADG